jgi:hypothetical protein
MALSVDGNMLPKPVNFGAEYHSEYHLGPQSLVTVTVKMKGL